MMRFLLSVGIAVLLHSVGLAQSLSSVIDSVRQQYAPDGRVALFQVTLDSAGTIVGKTNLPEAKQALLTRLNTRKMPFREQIQVLPAPSLEDKTYAVVTVSVANLRSNPRDAAELATQALLGMPLRVWDKDRGWYQVQTPDGYIAWVDFGGFERMTKAQFEAWEQTPKLIYTQPFGFCFSKPDRESQTVSDLVAGNLLTLVATTKTFYEVRYPDGRAGFVSRAEAQPYTEWKAKAAATEASLTQTARRLMGIPYLWGGTSTKGMDCSGFTKTVYALNGTMLARDASQQVHQGTLVPTPDHDFSQLRPGDLLFFGTPATADKPERVVHVGMWLGNGEFIHASGQIRVASLDPKAPHFNEYEWKRFLRAKRMR
ncbi:C40 family peptidase [Rudanella lutea]|uniref:C40 family peptidase n=1 Tax=Rudanella lutea TaxID=451374 RepID=UPI00039D0567|nr:C40 family peptidase [Rudanella lutea]